MDLVHLAPSDARRDPDELLKRVNGLIWAENGDRETGGTRFHLTLPRGDAPPELPAEDLP